MRKSEITIVAASILFATAASLALLYLLIHSSINNEVLAIGLAAAAFVTPVAIVIWVLYDGSARRAPPEVNPTPVDAAWLEIDGDDEQGYTLLGDARALQILGEQCLRLARDGTSGETATIGVDSVQVAKVVRQDVPTPVATPSWKERFGAIGCVALFAAAAAIWFRGCAAIEQDVQRWLK